jgi:hypothetical protein
MVNKINGKVAFACIHRRLIWRGEETAFYVLAFQDETIFVAKAPAKLFDALAKRITSPIEIPPGTEVSVRFHLDRGVRWMTALQIIRWADDDQDAFEPVEGEGVFSFTG